MIEIRVDQDDRPITPDGPHSPDRTRAVAEAIDAAFRLLNYATMSPRGLGYPADVYSVLGELAAAVNKLPQALRQMGQFIGDQVAHGRARENAEYGKHGGDAEAAHGEMAAVVRDASAMATELGRLLDKGQSAVRGLEGTRGEGKDVQ
jgi:hypothetical protein